MIGSLQKRDITLFGLLAAISIAIGTAGWFVSREFQEQMLQETAEDEALHMGFFVMQRLSDPAATFAYGAITEQDQDLINIVAETGNVYRYSFFNADGIIVVASRPGDLGRRVTDPFFFDVVRQGQTYVEFDTDVEFHPDDIVVDFDFGDDREGRYSFARMGVEARDRRDFVAEVYVPVIQDGAFLGAVEVYVDASGLEEYLAEEIEEARLGAGAMLLLLVIAFAFVVRGNIADRNRQLTTVQAASASLAMAEEEVLRLNTELEKRVDERTTELAKANEAVTKLNEDLERRVEERTEQISKANDQLYRLNESMTRLNESLEQRVEERTSALNKANADVLKLNEELERRVEERTSELHAAQADLLRNERLAALGQLTATVSHELRNPLGAIRTAVYLVAGRTKDKNLGVEGALERADRSITRCDNIITELLDFTRTTDLALESVPFDEWLSSVLDEQTVPKGIAFDNQVSTQGLEIAFDQDRFRRVIINVFNNGCEAMLEEAQAGSDKQHQMVVSSSVTDDKLEVRFSDNGPGIPPDILEKIFEPLYSTKSFGVGLGLPTVRQIMRQHGGDIEMQSTPGNGTTVVLWLPRNLDKDKQSSPDASDDAVAVQAAAASTARNAETGARVAAASVEARTAAASASAEPDHGMIDPMQPAPAPDLAPPAPEDAGRMEQMTIDPIRSAAAPSASEDAGRMAQATIDPIQTAPPISAPAPAAPAPSAPAPESADPMAIDTVQDEPAPAPDPAFAAPAAPDGAGRMPGDPALAPHSGRMGIEPGPAATPREPLPAAGAPDPLDRDEAMTAQGAAPAGSGHMAASGDESQDEPRPASAGSKGAAA